MSLDPINPIPGQEWVLRTSLTGTPIGLLLALTHSITTYQLSYKTQSGLIIRTSLR